MAEKQLNRIIIEVPEYYEQIFSEFLTLSILQGKKKEDAFAELVQKELDKQKNKDLLSRNWLTWEELEEFMLGHGYTINRTTFWKYRQSDEYKEQFDEMVKTNEVRVLFDGDGVLAFFNGEGVSV